MAKPARAQALAALEAQFQALLRQELRAALRG
jgi:hypothetical protein